jgi:predicted RNase H-like HicB family nuclease
MREYLVIIHKAGSNYSAYTPELLGCGALGDTIEELVQAMAVSLSLHIEGMVEDGEEVPMPKGLRYFLDKGEPFAEPNAFITHIAVHVPEMA